MFKYIINEKDIFYFKIGKLYGGIYKGRDRPALINISKIKIREPRFIWRYRKRIQNCIRYTIPRLYRDFKIICILKPVYVLVSITDCDHYHSEYVMKQKNGYAYLLAERDFYNDMENRGYIKRITKEEYDNHKPVSIDYVAEAHENGHPYNVRG
tara:strand:+ start:862 stop:1323 length:462 start_codon:yes stop_codon:yes gene_type:complete